MAIIDSPPPPPGTSWDPRTQLYVTPDCRAGRHKECPGGLDYYPEGITGARELVPCSCAEDGCRCAEEQ